jgi:uncharacterized protein (TIRG00374 family)
MKRNQRLIVILGLVISAFFLWLAFNDLNPAAVLAHVQEANPALLLLAVFWYFAGVTVISTRWRFLLRSTRVIPLRDLFQLVCIGYMGNNVYPLRAGEALRIVLLQRNHGVPMARGATIVLTERIFDGLVMLNFVLIALVVFDVGASETVRSLASVAAPVFLGALAVFFVVATRPAILRQLVKLVSRILPGQLRAMVENLSEEVIAGLGGLRTPADLAGAIICSHSWLLEASTYLIVARAFNLPVSYPTMLLVVGVVNLAGLIPASPGQFGVYEFFVITVLTSLTTPISEATATAFALVVHLVIWLPVTLLGFFFLARQGLGLSAIAHARDLEDKVTVS